MLRNVRDCDQSTGRNPLLSMVGIWDCHVCRFARGMLVQDFLSNSLARTSGENAVTPICRRQRFSYKHCTC
jgi:hypothetical protein